MTAVRKVAQSAMFVSGGVVILKGEPYWHITENGRETFLSDEDYRSRNASPERTPEKRLRRFARGLRRLGIDI